MPEPEFALPGFGNKLLLTLHKIDSKEETVYFYIVIFLSYN